jgi:hypothetical protein
MSKGSVGRRFVRCDDVMLEALSERTEAAPSVLDEAIERDERATWKKRREGHTFSPWPLCG